MTNIVTLTVMSEETIVTGAAFDIMLGHGRELYENGFPNVTVSTHQFEGDEGEVFEPGPKQMRPTVLQDDFFSDENTLLKVRESLMQYGMLETEALNAINDMQNKGILFRERH